jgi:hypothetical protein
MPSLAQSLSGSTAVGIAEHTPFGAFDLTLMHASHFPSQARLQQTPSCTGQKPLVH